jgi:hypothetical protein
MTDAQGWPDPTRETVEWALAVHFSGDRMPHMSGDPRNRLSPGRRRAMEDARDAVLDALAPILAALLDAARREEREACARVADARAADAQRWIAMRLNKTAEASAKTTRYVAQMLAAAIRARGGA